MVSPFGQKLPCERELVGCWGRRVCVCDTVTSTDATDISTDDTYTTTGDTDTQCWAIPLVSILMFFSYKYL